MRRFSACIEWLFAEDGDVFADRIRRAHCAGLDAVEFWRWSNKDLDAIAAAAAETGITVTGLVAEPMIALTDPANRKAWLAGLRESIKVAQRLGATILIAQAGDEQAGSSREKQSSALVLALQDAAEIMKDSGARLGIEPLNTKIDHVGYFLASTREALDIIDAVGSPEIGIVYDIYHSAVMDERTDEVLDGRVDRVVHVHVADHPGRNEPGTGRIDLAGRLHWLFSHGYDGMVGLEYKPTRAGSDAITAAIASLSA